MCGATDCPSCGPAQGYTVERRYRHGRVVWVNPDEDDNEDRDEDFDPPEAEEAAA